MTNRVPLQIFVTQRLRLDEGGGVRLEANRRSVVLYGGLARTHREFGQDGRAHRNPFRRPRHGSRAWPRKAGAGGVDTMNPLAPQQADIADLAMYRDEPLPEQPGERPTAAEIATMRRLEDEARAEDMLAAMQETDK